MKMFDINSPAKTRCIKVSRVNGEMICTGYAEEVKPVAIKNKTVRTLKNGVQIPTSLSMERRIAKFA